jgi:hypothetical protein
VKTILTPASPKARSLLKKLEALAERGIDGEKISAQRKLARLKARFDFTQPEETAPPDLFSGNFKRSGMVRHIYTFGAHEFDVANSVKWAIEGAAQVTCVFRHGELLAEATPGTAKRLTDIAGQIAKSFRALIEKFGALDGVTAGDRNVFVMGLYDGMMGETREAGQRLPGRAPVKKGRKTKQGSVTPAPGLHVHPYTVGQSLGRQIRFSAPLEQITAELAEATRRHIA